jgi:hypothetical protein
MMIPTMPRASCQWLKPVVSIAGTPQASRSRITKIRI